MDPFTLGVVLWVVGTVLLLLLKYVVEGLIAKAKGQPPPRIQRRIELEKLTRKYGTTTVGQAISERLAQRIKQPPQRWWAAELRALIDEVLAQAITEARVKVEISRRKRAERRRRQAAWTAHTGGTARPTPPPPPPSAGDDEVTTVECDGDGCDTRVVPPEWLCDDCAADPATTPPDTGSEPENDPEPDPAPDDHGEDPSMGSVTHTIAADVHNPCFALQFATDCRDFAHAVVQQFDILHGVQTRLKLGPDRIAGANQLREEISGYEAETEQSIEAYAKHVLIKTEIENDPDLVRTIEDTYLGGGTGDNRGVTPPKQTGPPPTLNAADCRTPEDCADFMRNAAIAFNTLKGNADEVIGAHDQDYLEGEPVELMKAQRDRTQRVATKATAEAHKYDGHAAKRNDTIGTDPSLRNTQRGGYMSPTGA